MLIKFHLHLLLNSSLPLLLKKIRKIQVLVQKMFKSNNRKKNLLVLLQSTTKITMKKTQNQALQKTMQFKLTMKMMKILNFSIILKPEIIICPRKEPHVLRLVNQIKNNSNHNYIRKRRTKVYQKPETIIKAYRQRLIRHSRKNKRNYYINYIRMPQLRKSKRLFLRCGRNKKRVILNNFRKHHMTCRFLSPSKTNFNLRSKEEAAIC